MERKVKHLEFIQGVVNRLSTNSFLLKGWSVVLVAALLGLGTQEETAELVYLALLPVLVLWGLDGYFLWQERLYRLLYDFVREKDEESIDFSMNPKPIMGEDKGWHRAVFSRTLVTFHGVLIIAIAVVMYLKFQVGNG